MFPGPDLLNAGVNERREAAAAAPAVPRARPTGVSPAGSVTPAGVFSLLPRGTTIPPPPPPPPCTPGTAQPRTAVPSAAPRRAPTAPPAPPPDVALPGRGPCPCWGPLAGGAHPHAAPRGWGSAVLTV